jgi:hypothetical protein
MKHSLKTLFVLGSLVSLTACGEAANEYYGPDGQILQSLTKGQPGAQVGDIDYCYDPNNRCDVGEGKCSNHSQCLPGLKCALRGEIYGYPGLRVCHPAHCLNSRLDADKGEVGIDCGGVCGDCEFAATCYNGVLDPGEDAIDCGGTDCEECETIDLTVNSPIPGGAYASLAPRAAGSVSAQSIDQRANRLVQFEIDGQPVGSTSSAANGAWDFRLPNRPPGVYTLRTVVDNGGKISEDIRDFRIINSANRPAQSQLQLGSKSTSISTRSAVIDPDDHTVLAGVVSRDFIFGATTIERGSAAGIVAFVARAAPDGTPLWATRIAGTGSTTINSVRTLSNGEIVVLGDFTGSIDLGSGSVAAAGARDAFVAKLSPSGQLLWGSVLSATGATSIRELTVTAQDEIIAIGNFTGTADLGGALTLPSSGGLDMFITKLDTNGNHIWGHSFGGSGQDVVNGVSTNDNGEIYITGSYEGAITFDAVDLAGPGSNSAFVVKLSTVGKTIWANDIGGDVSDSGVRVAVAPTGEIVVTGIFNGDVDFGGGVFATAATDNFDLFMVRYTSEGNHVWSRQIQAVPGDSITGLGVGPSNNVFITGRTYETIDLGNGPRTTVNQVDGFLAAYSPGGDLTSQRFFDAGREVTPRSLYVNELNSYVISGDLIGEEVDFGTSAITNTSRRSGFFARYQ